MDNPKHSKLAEAILAGKTQKDACIEAGYSPNSRTSSIINLPGVQSQIETKKREMRQKMEKRGAGIDDLVRSLALSLKKGDSTSQKLVAQLHGLLEQEVKVQVVNVLMISVNRAVEQVLSPELRKPFLDALATDLETSGADAQEPA